MSRALPALLLLAGCVRPGGDGPAEVKYDRDACRGCSMIISERRFVAEVKPPKGEVVKFDDVGCAVRWLDEQPFADDPAVLLWVAAEADGAWLDARAAGYLAGRTSPMGYGFGAQAAPGPGSLTFETMRQQVRAIAQRRH